MLQLRFISVLALALLSCEQQKESGQGALTGNSKTENLIGSSLFPSPLDEQLKREYVLAHELALTIERLEGVEEARVHLNLADQSFLSHSRRVESTAAILVLRSGEKSPDEIVIRKLATAAVPDLKIPQVSVYFTGPSNPPLRTVFVGPIEVVSSSSTSAKLCLGGLTVLCLVLALGLVGAGLKLRKRKKDSR